MCNRRCCCPDYWVRGVPSSPGTPSAWRHLRNPGTYPNNAPVIKDDNRLRLTTDAQRFTIDYRNKLIFTYRVSGTTYFVDRYDFNATASSKVNIFSGTFVSGGDARGLCCDYITGRVFYMICSAHTTGPNTSDYQIRSVNYDGTGDTLLYTEAGVADTGIGEQAGFLTWEPNNSYLYYFVLDSTLVTRPSPPTPVANFGATIYRINSDGTGHMIVVQYKSFSTVSTIVGGSIVGLTIAPSQGKLIWIARISTADFINPQTNTQDLLYSNLDGSGVTSIFQRTDFAPPLMTNCVYNNKDNGVYIFDFFDTQGHITRLPFAAGAVLADFKVQIADFQPAYVATGYQGLANPMFICKEFSGNDYHGGSQASNF